MKRFLLVLIYILIFNAAKAQWQFVPAGVEDVSSEVSIVNDSVVWIKNIYDSTILVSKNGGLLWRSFKLPFWMMDGGERGGLSAVGADTAYLVKCDESFNGPRGLYKTVDGGNSWTLLPVGFSQRDSRPKMVHFWNKNRGVALGDPKLGGTSSEINRVEIYTTDNGGVTWSKVPVTGFPIGYDELSSRNDYLRVHGDTIYFLTAMKYLYKSVDKGVHWTVQKFNAGTSTNSDGISFDFWNQQCGIATELGWNQVNIATYKEYYTNQITLDGGNSWTISRIPPIGIHNVFYDDRSKTIFGLNEDSGMVYSTNAGVDWNLHPTMFKRKLGKMGFFPDGRMLVTGVGGVYLSDGLRYKSPNLTCLKTVISSDSTLDVYFSARPDDVSARLIQKYRVGYLYNDFFTPLTIKSITSVAGNDSLYRLKVSNLLSYGTIQITISGISDFYGGSAMLESTFSINNSTIRLTNPGILSSLLTYQRKYALTKFNLKLEGVVNAVDIETLRSMTRLDSLDLKDVRIVSSTKDAKADELPSSAFNSSNIRWINLPQNLVTIKSDAFNFCRNLIRIVLPDSVRLLERKAFAYCENLKNIVLSKNIKTIEGYTFAGCSKLDSLMIPENVKKINFSAFSGCNNLVSVTVSNMNTCYTSDDNVVYTKLKDSLLYCPSSKAGTFKIPNTVRFIASSSFSSQSRIDTLQLTASVEQIAQYAMPYCPFYIDVDDANMHYKSQNGLLYNKNMTELITCPTSVNGDLVFPQSLRCIKENALSECVGITCLILPNELRTIENYAFAGCSKLRSIVLPDSLVVLGSGVFMYCSNLEQVTISSKVPIGGSMFSGCYSLNKVYLRVSDPATVPLISYAFENTTYSSCTLYVPVGCKTMYKNAVNWGSFLQINEFEQTVVESPYQSHLSVNYKDGMISICGIQTRGELTYWLYAPSGMLLMSRTVAANAAISLGRSLAAGVYILRLNHEGKLYQERILVN